MEIAVRIRKVKHVDALQKPIVVRFWNPSLAVWVKLSVKYNARAWRYPFSLHYEQYKTKPYVVKPYRVQPPNEYETLQMALEAMQHYIQNWSTEL